MQQLTIQRAEIPRVHDIRPHFPQEFEESPVNREILARSLVQRKDADVSKLDAICKITTFRERNDHMTPVIARQQVD